MSREDDTGNPAVGERRASRVEVPVETRGVKPGFMPEGTGSDRPTSIPEEWGVVAAFGGAYRRKDILVGCGFRRRTGDSNGCSTGGDRPEDQTVDQFLPVEHLCPMIKEAKTINGWNDFGTCKNYDALTFSCSRKPLYQEGSCQRNCSNQIGSSAVV